MANGSTYNISLSGNELDNILRPLEAQGTSIPPQFLSLHQQRATAQNDTGSRGSVPASIPSTAPSLQGHLPPAPLPTCSAGLLHPPVSTPKTGFSSKDGSKDQGSRHHSSRTNTGSSRLGPAACRPPCTFF